MEHQRKINGSPAQKIQRCLFAYVDIIKQCVHAYIVLNILFIIAKQQFGNENATIVAKSTMKALWGTNMHKLSLLTTRLHSILMHI